MNGQQLTSTANESTTALTRTFQEKLVKGGYWHCCLNCEDWKEDKCQRFMLRPPDTVLVVGCDYWIEEIPF